jgi:O-acetyl-ADP-ribose deacetylase
MDTTRVTAVVGDIVRQPDCDAIVNAANPQLMAGGGVCGAIHRAAGPELEACAIKLGPITVGDAVITPGFQLPNRWVIHAVGPRYFTDVDPPNLLSHAVRRALELADQHQVRRVALPAISTGIYGYPIEEAGPILVGTARDLAPSLRHLEEIRYVLVSPDLLRWFA